MKSASIQAPMRHPLREFVGRYRAVWQAAWSHRHELAGPARLADEAAFLPAALSLQETPPHPAPRRALWVIMGLFSLALAWACIGQVDIVAVAPGRIVVSDGTKLLQPLETSVVTAIHVRDGDKVKAGQLLIELDPTMVRAEANRVTSARIDAMSEFWRARALLALLKGGPAPSLPNPDVPGQQDMQAQMKEQLAAEWRDMQAQRAKLKADIDTRKAAVATVQEQIRKIEATLPIVRQRDVDFQALAKQGYVSAHDGQDRAQARIAMERDLATLQAQLMQSRATLVQAEQVQAAWQTDLLRKLSDRHAKADLTQRQLTEENIKARRRESQTALVAPTAGTVQQLAVHTVGGVVSPAQVLLVVVPDQSHVTAEVSLENKDVGFVNEGQSAEIKFETFPYTRYGTVAANVSTITADAVTDERQGAIFPATVTLAQDAIMVDGKAIRLAPGMNVTAEIKTGRRRVIDYLLSPAQRHVQESLRER